MKTTFSKKIILLLSVALVSCKIIANEGKTTLPIPTKAQLDWQKAELAVLISYDLHVSDGKRYVQAQNRITPIEDINMFHPDQLDTDQWIRAVKDMGAKIAILTATHETGFALYQSDVNPYCMKALKWRNGKGDIVRDFVNSCRKYGIKPGIYIGIRWNSFLGVYDFMMPKDGSEFQQNRQKFYNKMCEGMTEELMSRYGDLAIVWYDGGGHGPELGGADVLPIVEKYQKNIIFYHNSQRADIRWGGSESGTVKYPCWGGYPFPYSHSKNQEYIFKNSFELLKTGEAEGKYYMPAMSDAPLRGYNGRHEWFWEPNDEDHVFPLENLMQMYMGSVGRNSTLILGFTPDYRGLLPDVDVRRIKEFGAEINRRFKHPLSAVQGEGYKLMMKSTEPTSINCISISEDISKGERVRDFIVEGKVNGKWQQLVAGSCIGNKCIKEIKPVQVTALRLKINESKGKPYITDFSMYNY